MKIDPLFWKIFGVIAVLNTAYWVLTATVLDFSNIVSDSALFSLYTVPAILPVTPFLESIGNSAAFVPVVGALCLVFLPIFWSLVVYGVVWLVQKFRHQSR